MKRTLPLLFALVAFAIPALAQNKSKVVYVGMLEDRPPVTQGEGFRPRVKVLFKEEAGRWTGLYSDSLNSSRFPKSNEWTIAFDGKSLGTVRGILPVRFGFYSDVGEQRITQKNVPHVGPRSVKWADFTGESVYRPLVAVSEPNYKDPDGWKRSKPGSEVVKAAQTEFKKHFSKIFGSPDKKTHATKYSIDKLTMESYCSKDGTWLLMTCLSVEPEDDPSAVEGDPSGFLRLPIAITKSKHVIALPENETAVVDAGDYDGDGHSEIILTATGYNHGGYALYTKNFETSAKFEFRYH